MSERKHRLAWNGRDLQLLDFPGAGNVIRLEGPPATRLAHLSLHRVDLEFAQACLSVIESAPREQWHTPAIEAAWRSALLHYCKCFAPPQGGTGRSQLSATRVFGPESGQPMKDHRLMLDLRNKHLVHDEGTHNWCAVTAVIAPTGTPGNLVQVTVAAMDSVSLDHLTVPALRALVDRVHAWTRGEFEILASDIGLMLERTHAHSELLAKKALGVYYKSKPPKRGRGWPEPAR